MFMYVRVCMYVYIYIYKIINSNILHQISHLKSLNMVVYVKYVETGKLHTVPHAEMHTHNLHAGKTYIHIVEEHFSKQLWMCIETLHIYIYIYIYI
jgi:hypothetical protein